MSHSPKRVGFLSHLSHQASHPYLGEYLPVSACRACALETYTQLSSYVKLTSEPGAHSGGLLRIIHPVSELSNSSWDSWVSCRPVTLLQKHLLHNISDANREAENLREREVMLTLVCYLPLAVINLTGLLLFHYFHRRYKATPTHN